MTNTTIKQKASRAVRAGVVAGLVAIGLVMVGRSPRAATGTLVPALYQTVLDANGNPVSGAKICTYLGGTSTPVATYTDVNLTVPAANPITADSAGRWSTYLATGVSYKFVLQDATGTAGVCNGAIIRTIDTVAAIPGTANPTVAVNTADVRLTLLPGVPVTTADAVGATTVYVTPYQGNRIALYDGTQWNLRVVTETAIAVPFAAGAIYDVFAVDTFTVPTYEVQTWLSETTRAVGLVSQDGVLSKAGQITRRYLGTFLTTAVAGQTEDSAAKRYVWNYAHRVDRVVQKLATTSAWTYTSAVWHQPMDTGTQQIEVIVGVSEDALSLQLVAAGQSDTGGGAGIALTVGIGEDTSTGPLASALGMVRSTVPSTTTIIPATLVKVPAIGRHVYTWLEASQAVGTTTWFGANNALGLAATSSGLSGRWKS